MSRSMLRSRGKVPITRFKGGFSPWHEMRVSHFAGAQVMPVGVVKPPEDEIAWERAKARGREQYPDARGEQFYRIVMAIYNTMTHYAAGSRRRTEIAW